MKTIFVGGLYPQDREDEVRLNSKNGIDNAANNLQWALLAGLDHFYPDIQIVTQPSVGAYPLKYKSIFLKGSTFSHKSSAEDYCLGFINIPLIKHLYRYFNLYHKLKELTSDDEKTIIIIYGITSPFLKAVVDLKNKRNRIKICQIVPDLPQFMSESKNPIYQILKRIDSVLINKCLKNVDSFILLNDYMADMIGVNNRPWIRIEGIFNSTLNINALKEKETVSILYTGNIGERYGINELLDAFNLIEDEKYQLWIRGNGKMKKNVLKAAKSDRRIKYIEEMPRDKLLELQKKASILINPVPTSEKFSKYFFPSKLMDYLASGTPTIITRLECIPKEYYDYVFVAETDDAKGLKDIIVEVTKKSQLELDEFGKRASQFIIENKNPIVQVAKIYNMINQL